eukprot:SAG22_NODE_1272_length_4923_cov_3.681385_6_plen_95_part_00
MAPLLKLLRGLAITIGRIHKREMPRTEEEIEQQYVKECNCTCRQDVVFLSFLIMECNLCFRDITEEGIRREIPQHIKDLLHPDVVKRERDNRDV